MRTLQEKYNGIQEGTFSKEHFLAEARMQQPQLITRFNGYDDTVQILKNRGMIVEGINLQKYLPKIKEVINNPDYEIGPNDSHMSEAEQVWHYLAQDFKELDSVSEAEWDQVNDLIEAELKKRKSVTEAKLTKKSLTDYRYKPTNDMDKYPYEQILRGLRVELEAAGVLGTPTPEEYSKALAKVSKNLAKDSIFYTNQVAGVNPKVDLHDKMVTATAKNTVDTFNGMKKAALKEGFKKLIKKVLSESSNDLADLFDTSDEPQGRGEYEFYSDPENYNEEEEEFELQQEGKSDSEYKSELSDYLEDNQIYGYADMIYDIMTGPDEEENSASLADFLDDHQIYGYNKGIERIFADYPYDQHWMNKPDDNQMDESRMGDLYITAQESDTFKDFLIKVKQEYPQIELRKAIKELEHIWNERGEDEDLYEGKKSLSQLLK